MMLVLEAEYIILLMCQATNLPRLANFPSAESESCGIVELRKASERAVVVPKIEPVRGGSVQRPLELGLLERDTRDGIGMMPAEDSSSWTELEMSS